MVDDLPQKPKNETLTRILLVLFSLGFSLILLELGARVFYGLERNAQSASPTTVLHVPDETLEWFHEPGTELTVETQDGDGEVLIQINSKGLRDTEYDYEHPDNTFRILIIGDSYVEAFQVNLEDAFHYLLEERLNAELSPVTGLKYEVIAGGVAAYGTTRTLAFYEEEGAKYNADLVIHSFYLGNDFRDDHIALAQSEPFPGIFRKGFYSLDENGDLVTTEAEFDANVSSGGFQAQQQATSLVTKIDSQLFSYSRLYFYVRPFLTEQIPFIRKRLYSAGIVGSEVPFPPQYSPDARATLDEAWELEAALVPLVRDTVERNGSAYSVMVVPDYLMIHPEFFLNDHRFYNEDHLELMDRAYSHDQINGILTENDIPFINLYDPLRVYQEETGAVLYGAHSKHWNVAGHAVAADLIYDWLVENELVGD